MAVPRPPRADIMRVNSILTESSPSKYNPTTRNTSTQPQSEKPAAPRVISSSSFTPVNLGRPVQIQALPSPYQTPYQSATQSPLQVIQPIPPLQAVAPVQIVRHVQPSPSIQTPSQIQPAISPAAQSSQPAPSTVAIIPTSATDNRYAYERYYDEKREHEAAQKAAGIPPTSFRQIQRDELEDMEPDMSPQLVRTKLNALFDVEKYGKGKFCDEAGTTNKSLNTFMNMSGSNGRQTSAYEAGWKFFKLRQLREKATKEADKAQQKKRKSAGGEEGAPAAKATKTTAGKNAAQPHIDISDIHLPGEETDSVEVYDTCDDIRAKITPYLSQPGITAASFLRSICAQYHTKPRSIQSKQLTDFRNKRGPEAGNTSAVFYGSYVFFEKIRIKEGREKTGKRLENEREYGSGGVDIKHAERGGGNSSRHGLCGSGV
ncbi:hypothetical protein E2P81_ATG00332 [Venturia nashicola]|uniref:DUF7726 domain-containing protein n=1 Tax=Venturia nashicola TaxID=86259 RepID=A0A4Z1PI66_9PEZI|nr:hypothetical protein E6O75_ATG00344 [Venturia nashicola]TLD39345.1 hypothetical protein E2P81_ATG00332 [Venturia nashicola]